MCPITNCTYNFKIEESNLWMEIFRMRQGIWYLISWYFCHVVPFIVADRLSG